MDVGYCGLKIKYLGKKTSVKRGCPVCGRRGKTEYKVLVTNTYYTPSGHRLTFRIGQEYDIDDVDAEFLLSLGDEFIGVK